MHVNTLTRVFEDRDVLLLYVRGKWIRSHEKMIRHTFMSLLRIGLARSSIFEQLMLRIPTVHTTILTTSYYATCHELNRNRLSGPCDNRLISRSEQVYLIFVRSRSTCPKTKYKREKKSLKNIVY